MYYWPAYDGTLPTIGDAVCRVEQLGYKIYVSDHPNCTTRRGSLLDTPHLFCSKCNYTLRYITVNHYPNIYTGVKIDEDEEFDEPATKPERESKSRLRHGCGFNWFNGAN